MLTRSPELPTSSEPTRPIHFASSEPDNQLRYRAGQREGHVESLFLKGNSPDGRRALWVKYTLLSPQEAPERAVAELWAVAFDRERPAPIANKQRFRLADVRIEESPFVFSLPTAELKHGHARGELLGGGPQFRWDLRYSCAAQAFRPFPSARMYSGAFPRTKTLTPAPDTFLTGFFEVAGERWSVDGFTAAQGHNWGKGHAHTYAWAHANALELAEGSAPARHSWLELLTGRVRVGPLLTPPMSCAAIAIDEHVYRFDNLRNMLARSVSFDMRSYQFRFRQGDAELEGRIVADPRLIAGLRYEDPDGKTLACLNSKLATGTFTLRAQGKVWQLASQRVALEIGTRANDHGIAILV